MRGPVRNPDRDISEEIQHHIDECADLLMAQGWGPEEARQEAQRRFGDPERVKERLGELEQEGAWLRALVEWSLTMGANVRYALRALRLNLGFAAAVVLTLGLGAGVATSTFAVVDAVALRPLPYAEADRWVEAMTRLSDGRRALGQRVDLYEGWNREAPAFADAWVGYYRFSMVRTGGIAAEPVSAVALSAEAPELLGLPLLLGRGFTQEDAQPGATPVALLGRHYWERLGADPNIVGTEIRFASGSMVVVGVIDAGVKVPEYGQPAEVWVPLPRDLVVEGRPLRGIQGVWARLLPNVSVEEAQLRADARAEALQEQRPRERGWGLYLQPLGSRELSEETSRALWMLAATAGLLLLIATANGINLLLVRATARAGEFSVRRALGASRSHLVGQLLTEGMVLGLLGGVTAAVFAALSLEAVTEILPRSLVFFSPHPVSLESRGLAFAFVIAFGAALAFGLIPGLHLLRDTPASPTARGASERPTIRRSRHVLVAGQVAIATVLLFGASLFLRSVAVLLSEDPGIDYRHTGVALLELSDGSLGPEARVELLDRLARQAESLPDVERAGYAGGILYESQTALTSESGTTADEEPGMVPTHLVSADYLEATGTRLIHGRPITSRDYGRDVVVIDRDLARLLWGPEDPTGERFRIRDGEPWLEVVGVVEELRLRGRDQREGPYQMLRPIPEEGPLDFVQLVVRTSGDPAPALPALRRMVGEVAPTVAVHQLQTGSQLLAAEESQPRFLLIVMGLLGVVAVLLATVGLYGVLAYTVRRRTRELGVRMALGASSGSLLRLVLSEGMALACMGIVIGLIGSYFTAGVSEALLYKVAPRDPWIFVATGALFLAVALVASLVPARRATSVDPVSSLRVE